MQPGDCLDVERTGECRFDERLSRVRVGVESCEDIASGERSDID